MDLFSRLKADSADDWRAYTEHDFVTGMGDGSLPIAAFRHYLVQDYLFLIQFARAYALAIFKGDSLEDMRSAHEGLKAILDVEMDLHVKLCGGWDIGKDALEQAAEARATTAYTRFVLDCGMRGDLLDLHTALAPCVIGYAEIGSALTGTTGSSSEGPYAAWINEYSGEAYQDVARAARKSLDQLAERLLTETRYPSLLATFRQATRLEADFWQMGLTLAE